MSATIMPNKSAERFFNLPKIIDSLCKIVLAFDKLVIARNTDRELKKSPLGRAEMNARIMTRRR